MVQKNTSKHMKLLRSDIDSLSIQLHMHTKTNKCTFYNYKSKVEYRYLHISSPILFWFTSQWPSLFRWMPVETLRKSTPQHNYFAIKIKKKDILMINHDERCYVIWQHTWKILWIKFKKSTAFYLTFPRLFEPVWVHLKKQIQIEYR